MASLLFWIALPAGFFAVPVGLIQLFTIPVGIVCLFIPFAAPRDFVLGAMFWFFVTAFPATQRLGLAIWKKLDPSEDNLLHAKTLGSTLLGTVYGLVYCLQWLDYAAKNPNTWLIWIEWFEHSLSLWTLAFLIYTSWSLRRSS